MTSGPSDGDLRSDVHWLGVTIKHRQQCCANTTNCGRRRQGTGNVCGVTSETPVSKLLCSELNEEWANHSSFSSLHKRRMMIMYWKGKSNICGLSMRCVCEYLIVRWSVAVSAILRRYAFRRPSIWRGNMADPIKKINMLDHGFMFATCSREIWAINKFFVLSWNNPSHIAPTVTLTRRD